MRMLFEASSHHDLLGIIRSVRNRWRLRIALRGLAIVLGAGIVAFLISAYGMDRLRFSSAAVIIFRVLTYGTLISLAIRYLILPLIQRVTDEQVALYLEEHEPSLTGQVMSGVQFGDERTAEQTGHSPALVRRMVRSAIERCVLLDDGRRVERRKLVQSSGFLAGATVTGAVLLLLNPPFLKHSAPFLLSPWGSEGASNPYSITVTPGDASLARGADLRVGAVLHNFDTDVVDLVVKRGEEGDWEQWPMTVDEETGEYALLLFDLQDETEYYVEASGVRSPTFRVTVADLPYVDRIDLVYRFPAYTGLSPQRQENGGDIAALAGTRVALEITPTMTVGSGRIVLDGQDTLDLTLEADGRLSGSISVRRAGMYHVLLESAQGNLVRGSSDYVIDVLTDQPPTVSFVKPGRDIRVTSVEEVYTEIRADDDYGVAQLELVYSVNGAPEQTVPLYAGSVAQKNLSASYTFYLEETELEPGDFISYYARAVEADRAGGSQEAATDIYFMEVRPFGREYREAEQRGGNMGGEGGMDAGLSERQRDIVAATFRLVRDRDKYSDDDYRENLATLALAQGRLREEVESLVRRLTTRRIVQMDSSFRAVAEALPVAVEAMAEAEQELGERKPKDALPPEQRALQHLQRAEAAYREIQVSRGGGGGGGGGQQSDPEELADLFDLELDKMRNQYEQVERGRQQRADQEVDEVLQKLKELAQRQQQQNERMRAQLQRQSAQAGGASGQAQRNLAEQAEDLARRLERLAREESRPELQETARSLREAAEAMRRAAASARNNGVAQGAEALDELREARRLLDKNRSARLERDAENALRRAQRLAQEQREITSAVERLSTDPQARTEQIERLRERKNAMADEVADIEAQLDRVARESQREQRDASRKLQAAAQSIRDNKLKEKIQYSRGVIAGRSTEYAQAFEEQIGANLDELRDKIEEAVDAVGETREQRLSRSLDQTRDAVNALESLRERLRERTESGDEQAQQGQRDQEGRQTPSGQQPGQQAPQGEQPQAGGQPQGGMQPPQGGGGGPGRLNPQARRQFRRELQERQNELSELRRELGREGVDTGELDRVIAGLREFERRRDIGDPRGLAQLEADVIQGLKDFEYTLRKQLLGADVDRVLLAGSDDVPEQYKQMVEEYYKELSRRGGNRQ